MTTRFFRFPDMATGFQLAAQNGLTYTDEHGEPWLKRYCHEWAIDVIGEISAPGTYDEDGNELTPPVPLPGWHVNVRTGGDVPASFLSFEVFPATASRDFA